jgi:tetratricopeptide (TPR) repeat protein
MIRLRSHVFHLLIGALAIAAAPIVCAQEAPVQNMSLSVDQMQLAAELNLRNGHLDRAVAFADALLQRDPNDITALLVRAHALRILERYDEAQEAARSGWRSAETDTHRYTAAMLMAQALSSDGKRTRAQLWLRRARGVAPSAQHAAMAAQDFRYVQQRNPWQTQLSFTLAPNSNINNGSARDSSSLLYEFFTPLFGTSEVALGASSQALSGIEAGITVQSRYRFSQTEFRAHDLRLGMSYRSYRLSQSARDDLAAENAERLGRGEDVRDISGRDFAYGTVQIGYGFKQLRQDRRGEFSAAVDIGQSFYGGARYNSFLRAQMGQSYFATRTTKFDFGVSADLRRAQRGDDQNTYTVDTGMSRKLARGDGLFVGVALATATSDRTRLEYDEIKLRSGYVLGRDIMGTALQFGINTSFRDFDVSPHDPSGRREFEVGAEVTSTFKQIDYMGFTPTVSLRASSTNSNIGLYDVNRVAVGFGIASAF